MASQPDFSNGAWLSSVVEDGAASLSRLESAPPLISSVADALLTRGAGGVDPGDRWRLFAVAASATLVNGQQDVDLYVARLRMRRATPHSYTHDRAAWLRDDIDVKRRRTSARLPSK
jgi:hypothetical protein